MAPDIDIHVITSCPFCVRAINWLDTWGLTYNKIVYTDLLTKKKFYEEYNVSSVPQIFVNGKRIGGWTDLCKSDFKTKVENGEDVSDY